MNQHSQQPLALPEYAVPESESRGWVQPLADARGRGYFYGVGSLGSGVASIVLILLALGTYGLSLIAALIAAAMAIYLGIRATANAKKPHPTAFSRKATTMGTWGIVCGVLALLLDSVVIVFLVYLVSSIAYYW